MRAERWWRSTRSLTSAKPLTPVIAKFDTFQCSLEAEFCRFGPGFGSPLDQPSTLVAGGSAEMVPVRLVKEDWA